MKIIILFLVIFMSGEQVFAAGKDICFEKTLPFFQNFSKITGPDIEKSATLVNACDELQTPEMTKGKTILGAAVNSFMTKVAFGITGHATGAFDNLNGSQKQKSFRAELEKIKQIPNSMDRIKQVYDLVVRTQGHYDDDNMGKKNVLTGKVIFTDAPSNIINAAEKTGTGGVCRDFASLLQWSLLQVARGPHSKNSALEPNDFSSEFITGYVPVNGGTGGHAWVRVHLPQYNSTGQLTGFNNFDLDTTFYSDFSPLFPRLSGLSPENQQRAVRECTQIISCLYSRTLSSRRLENNSEQIIQNQKVGVGFMIGSPPIQSSPNTGSGVK